MHIQWNKATVVIIPICFFQMAVTFVTLVVSENTDFSSNKIYVSICSFLYYIHIGAAKYGIQSIKTENAKNITIHKTNGSIYSSTFLWVTDDRGVIRLIRNQMYSDHGRAPFLHSKFATFHNPCLL